MAILIRKGIFEVGNGVDFDKGDKVRLGDGREGKIVSKVERTGFSGYQVEITDSPDDSQVGSVVGASPAGMQLIGSKPTGTGLIQTLIKSRTESIGRGDLVRIANLIDGHVTDIQMDFDGNRTYTILPVGGGMRLKRPLEAIRRITAQVGMEVTIPAHTEYETEGIGRQKLNTDTKGKIIEDFGGGLYVVSVPDGDEILITEEELHAAASHRGNACPNLYTSHAGGTEGFGLWSRHDHVSSPFPSEPGPLRDKKARLPKRSLFVNLPDIEPGGGTITDRELLRMAIIAELDAASLYEKMAKMTANQGIGDVMNKVAAEEKTHAGEFETLLKMADGQQATEIDAGAQEVADILGEELPVEASRAVHFGGKQAQLGEASVGASVIVTSEGKYEEINPTSGHQRNFVAVASGSRGTLIDVEGGDALVKLGGCMVAIPVGLLKMAYRVDGGEKVWTTRRNRR